MNFKCELDFPQCPLYSMSMAPTPLSFIGGNKSTKKTNKDTINEVNVYYKSTQTLPIFQVFF